MLNFSIRIRLIFLALYILTKFNLLLSESYLICYNQNFEIKCIPEEQYIVIKEASYGVFSTAEINNVKWNSSCTVSEIESRKYNRCKTTVLKSISNKCSGQGQCTGSFVFSKYIPKTEFTCPGLSNDYHKLSLHIQYECVTKDLFFSVENLREIHFVGGYITSVGYISQKSNAHDEYKVTGSHFRTDKLLPIKRSFRPVTQLAKLKILPIVFQIQILENSLYSYQNNLNSTNTCQIGDLYNQDYYAFIPNNSTLTANITENSLMICESSRDMVGEIFGPITANNISITSNVNFTDSPYLSRGLLIKYTTIFCPKLEIKNAKITYDSKIKNKQKLEVISFARIECIPGYYLSATQNHSTVEVTCNHDQGSWDLSTIPDSCINKSVPQSSKTQIPTSTPPTSIVSTSSTNSSLIPSLPPVTVIVKSDGYSAIYIIIIVVGIVVIAAVVLLYVCCRNNKMTWIKAKDTCLLKFLAKNKKHPNSSFANTFKNHCRSSAEYTQVIDSCTPISGTLRHNGFNWSSNGSCRQSNRTLTTRADSKPTIASRDSFPMSNYISDNNINQINHEDELPSKVPKRKLFEMIRSNSSLRNHPLNKFRPTSLSRQSFTDRSSNIYDSRYSSSQTGLLKGRRNNVLSEFIEMEPSMWTSDISHSRNTSRYPLPYRNNSQFNNNSQSDVSSKFNSKIYSATTDTYLEPKIELSNQLNEEESVSASPRNPKKKDEEYMVYDHSSNVVDSTCLSSVTESFSNENDENKRFSMISNNYYGLQNADVRPNCYNPNNNNIISQTSNNNNNDSVYESIDDDHVYQSTLERRHMALPPPPNED